MQQAVNRLELNVDQPGKFSIWKGGAIYKGRSSIDGTVDNSTLLGSTYKPAWYTCSMFVHPDRHITERESVMRKPLHHHPTRISIRLEQEHVDGFQAACTNSGSQLIRPQPPSRRIEGLLIDPLTVYKLSRTVENRLQHSRNFSSGNQKI
jgi:hypothetical protein